MKPNLSIIIPCYNCSATLEEAVDSCFRQNLNGLANFEIVMVDDCSTDATRDLMQKLANEHPEIKLFYHSQNKGGGATRNTAVSHAEGEVIFCLDSDDILGDGTLAKMFTYLQKNNCDGVGVSTSIKFKGQNTKDVAFINNFSRVGEKIQIADLFEKGPATCSLYSVFMHTKVAFEKIGGYPTDHGFDTQGFAFRFLANGLTAHTCPDTIYFHRIAFNRSYYIREYESGKANHNWFKIYDESLYLFNDDAIHAILSFDLNNTQESLNSFISKRNNILRQSPVTDSIFYNYWLGSESLRLGKKEEAYKYLMRSYNSGLKYPAILTKLHETGLASGHGKEFEKAAKSFYSYKTRGSRAPIIRRIYLKIFKIISDISFIKSYRAIITSRLTSTRPLSLLIAWHILKIKKLLKIDFKLPNSVSKKTDNTEIDLVIPTVSKDFDLLNESISGAKKNLIHKINKIFIVSRKNLKIEDFCKKNNYTFIDELSVLGYGKDSISYKVDGIDRSGWMFQQLLKLSGNKFVEMENYIIIDSDTILINPHSFIEDDKFVFLQNEEWHQPYFDSFKKMFGYEAPTRLSYTSHMMIFNTKNLALMKKEIESKHGKSWDKTYASTANDKEMSCISDYDTYANWVLANFPDKVKNRVFYNEGMSRKNFDAVESLAKKFGSKYNSLSFHSYKE